MDIKELKQEYRSYLSSRQTVSVATLMSELDVGYREAREIIDTLLNDELCVAPNAEEYILDCVGIAPRVLSDSECLRISETFVEGEEIFLHSLYGHRYINDVGRAAFAGKDERVARRCVALGFAHEFGGKYRLSVSLESIDRITEYKRNERYDMVLVKLAHPVMLMCTEAGDTSADILLSPMFESFVKEYIKSNIKGYIDSEAFRWAENRLRDRTDMHRIISSMVNAIILGYEYDSVEEYVREAAMACEAITNSPYTNRLIRECAAEAVEMLRHTKMPDIQLTRELGTREFRF